VRVVATADGKSYETTSDADGRYSIAELPPGSYTVKAELDPRLTNDTPRQVQVPVGGCADISVYTQWNGIIRGRVIDWEGKPVRHPGVNIVREENIGDTKQYLNTDTATSHEDGSFEARPLPPGRYAVGFHLNREPNVESPYVRTWASAGTSIDPIIYELGEGGVIENVEIRLPKPLSIQTVRILVTERDGSPVDNAMILVMDSEFPWSSTPPRATRIASGTYEVQVVVGRTYSITCNRELGRGFGRHGSVRDVTIEPETRNIPVRLNASWDSKGLISD
jgi:hypothetical protein